MSSIFVVKAVPADIVLLESVVFKVTVIIAFAALGEETSYPNIFACDTALDRKDVLSRNISFASIFAL